MNVDTLLKFHRPNHSNAQMDFLITGRTGLTHYGRFKQAVREFAMRRHSLLDIQLEIVELRLRETTNQIEAYRMRLKFEALQNLSDSILRELTRFYHQACHYYVVAEVNEDNIEALETDLLTTQLAYQAGLDILANGHVAAATIAGIAALPKSRRQHLLQKIKEDPAELQENVVWWPDPYVPAITHIDMEHMRELVAYNGPKKELLQWSQP